MLGRVAVWAMVATGCRLGFDERGATIDASDSGGPDAAPCFTAFGNPTPLGAINTAADEYGAGITGDALELVFYGMRPGGVGGGDVWTARRASIADPFGPVTLVPNINTTFDEGGASLSSDGLTI